ncbi:MAG: hypothetical protein SFV51_16850 [Bryobacteraceae bacterium]|nr:hypothetical protein [Bryobacteraceae bacterium]
MRRLVFWEYKRGSWQYDIIVGLILAFIFLTPRAMFRDQPRASDIVMLPGQQGTLQFWMEPDLLSSLSEPQRLDKANQLLRKRTGKHYRVTRMEPIFDSEQDIRGYMAYATE